LTFQQGQTKSPLATGIIWPSNNFLIGKWLCADVFVGNVALYTFMHCSMDTLPAHSSPVPSNMPVQSKKKRAANQNLVLASEIKHGISVKEINSQKDMPSALGCLENCTFEKHDLVQDMDKPHHRPPTVDKMAWLELNGSCDATVNEQLWDAEEEEEEVCTAAMGAHIDGSEFLRVMAAAQYQEFAWRRHEARTNTRKCGYTGNSEHTKRRWKCAWQQMEQDGTQPFITSLLKGKATNVSEESLEHADYSLAWIYNSQRQYMFMIQSLMTLKTMWQWWNYLSPDHLLRIQRCKNPCQPSKRFCETILQLRRTVQALHQS
jgi:hypothetical protein